MNGPILIRGATQLAMAGSFSALGGYAYDIVYGNPASLDTGFTLFGLGAAVLFVPAGAWLRSLAGRVRSGESSGAHPEGQ